MKTIAVVIAGREGTGETREVEISPGSTPRDLIAALNLDPAQWVVARENSSQAYASDEAGFYQDLVDGQKVRLTPLASVGDGTVSAEEQSP